MGWKGMLAAALIVLAVGACDDFDPLPDKRRDITIADLTGLSQDHALRLVDNLDLHLEVETVEATGRSELARDVVLRQAPPAGTKVPPGSTLTLFVPEERALRESEEPFRLLTHCGLSFPLRFGGRNWLPVDRRLRRSVNPPDGFASNGFYDRGTITRVDDDTLVYTSSMGVEVEYQPTDKKQGGCD